MVRVGPRSQWRARRDLVWLTSSIALPRSTFDQLAPWEREHALAWAVGVSLPTAVVTGAAALRLHGIGCLERVERVDLLLAGDVRAKSAGLYPDNVRYHSAYLDDEEFADFGGLRVVAPWRAARDVALYGSDLAGIVAMDMVRRECGDVRELILGERRYPGKARIRALLKRSVSVSESVIESWGRLQLEDSGLPCTVECQVRIHCSDGALYRVDMLIDGWLILEFDGMLKYSTQDDPKREARRQHSLTNTGYGILRVEYRHLREGHFVEMVRRALLRGPGFGPAGSSGRQ